MSRNVHLLCFALVFASAAAVLGTLASGEGASVVFTDTTQSAGIDWKHTNGESPDRYLIETMGGGVAFLDFDNDGLLDLCLVTGGTTPRGKTDRQPLNALYKNLGNGRFRNVAASAGVDRIPFYGMGIAVADYDNDGFPDIYITGFPSSALFHNNRNGTFSNVTAKAGVANQGKLGASAAWFDYDRDGYLDLFVTNYVKFSYDGPQHCTYQGQPTYCAQTAYQGDTSRLYRNNKDGTFTDVTSRAGLSQILGRALGVVTLDADGDGWPDLFVSRDASPNLLLINQHDGTFRDAAVRAEVAFNADGNARAGMGVDAGDVTGQGWPSLSITNFNDENHALFINRGHLFFEERTIESGLAAMTHQFVGWGVHFLDYDNDGKLDLMMVNGHLNEVIEQTRNDVSYREPPLLLHNRGNGAFENVAKLAGPVFQQKFRSRGLTIGDFDNDGRIDAVFTRLDDTPILLHNTYETAGSWIGLELQGTRSSRDAIGAKVVLSNGNETLVRWVQGGGSYLSSHDKRLLIGLGNAPGKTRNLEITWPSGQKQSVRNLDINHYHKITEPR